MTFFRRPPRRQSAGHPLASLPTAPRPAAVAGLATAAQLVAPCAPVAGCERALVCIGPNCARRNSRAVWKEFERQLARYGLRDQVRVRYMFCLHHCELGPNMELHPGGTWYAGVRPQDTEEIIREHVCGGQIVERLTRDASAEPQWRDDWPE